MTSLKEQTQAKVAQGRKANPSFMAGVDEAILQAKNVQTGNKAIQLEQTAPNFELPNQTGSLISLTDLLAAGPVVITFYRGGWCPYCNLQLRALQARLPDIQRLGAQLVAISPQVPDGSMSTYEISDIDFTVLSDQNANIAESYGVAWKVPEVLLTHMRDDRKLDLEAINNGNATVLPIPATFVLDKNGVVIWRYVDVDYRTRSEPEDIINVLAAC